MNFRGRARRREYWTFQLVNCVLALGMLALGGAAGSDAPYFAFIAVVLVPSIAAGVRRLHDIGRSGWWYLLAFVPFGGLVVFVWSFIDSDPHGNKYGDNPKSLPGLA
ncbi:DUF805 domain-containing protein [Longispora albida]|uniref:DUF805 domain-containing protein n=1 Tax=Longispora albida TaxID=203523 RepID=UPI0003A7EA8F|nr:DUF805 domain-containing protein [Longispora albida]